MAIIDGSTTELEAVNEMLETAGFPPVDDVNDSFEAQRAYKLLIRVSREVQSQGWNFNKEYCVPITTNQNNEIIYPDSVLQLDSSNRADYSLIRRDGKLYDKRKHTFRFAHQAGTVVNLDIVYFISFDDLPEPARKYITIKSVRDFLIKYHGESELYSLTERQEFETKANFMRDDMNTGDYNMLDSYDAGSIFYRNQSGSEWLDLK